jgi:hypothetical protein
MPQTIVVGKILLREGTLLPGGVRLESEPYASGWRVIKNLDGYGLGRKIHEAGWTLFSHAGGIKTIAFGFDQQRAVHRAMRQVLAQMQSLEFNALEIISVSTRHFMGLPYVSVSARARHIQESVVLFQPQTRPVTNQTRLAAA